MPALRVQIPQVDLGKKVLKELVDMKIEMFKELELEGYAGESSALTQQKFMALRRMLQDSETKRGKLNAALDAALRAKLADLGIEDSKTSEQLKAFWAANKILEISKFKFKFPRARTYEFLRARSMLYRSQILQVNTRWN